LAALEFFEFRVDARDANETRRISVAGDVGAQALFSRKLAL